MTEKLGAVLVLLPLADFGDTLQAQGHRELWDGCGGLTSTADRPASGPSRLKSATGVCCGVLRLIERLARITSPVTERCLTQRASAVA